MSAGEDSAKAARWEHFQHGADMGVRGVAGTESGALEQAAMALAAVLTDPSRVTAQQAVEVDCEAPDHELLLVDWLNALV
ncbi:MAG: archease [Gammaproteobacteria bacterium]